MKADLQKAQLLQYIALLSLTTATESGVLKAIGKIYFFVEILKCMYCNLRNYLHKKKRPVLRGLIKTFFIGKLEYPC